MKGSEWLGTNEASSRLGITLRTLYRLIDEGFLPAYKLGRVIRIKTADVETFLEAQQIEPGSLAHLYPEPKEEKEEPPGRRRRKA